MNNLILLRHGQSQWNLENKFTGWTDVPLTNQGIKEAEVAGEVMKKNNIKIDKIYSSVLQRAYNTAIHALKCMDLKDLYKEDNILEIKKNKNLNERDYGDLVGLNKEETAKKFGKDQVHIWRRSYDVQPPGGESLKEVVQRVKPVFDNEIKPELERSKNVLIVAHGNSLRAILIHLNLYKPEEISKIELPTGAPFIINFENSEIINYKFLN